MQYDVKGEFPRILSEYMTATASQTSQTLQTQTYKYKYNNIINNKTSNTTLGIFYNGRELTQSDTAYELDMTADAELVVMMHRKSDGILIDLN